MHFEKDTGAVEHVSLGGPGIALHTDNAVLFCGYELDRVHLALFQRTFSLRPFHGALAQNVRTQSPVGFDQGDCLAFLCDSQLVVSTAFGLDTAIAKCWAMKSGERVWRPSSLSKDSAT